MRTLIKNRIVITNPTRQLYNWCLDNLVITNPTYDKLMRLGKVDQIARFGISKEMYLFVERGDQIILPYGCLYAIWPMIKDFEFDVKLNCTKDISCRADVITEPLYDYQEEAVQKMIAAKSGILIGGCGSGKTNCGVEIAHRIGKKFLWLTHTKDLVKQSYQRFKRLYPNMQLGIVGDGKVDFGIDGTIATVQTMEKLDPEIYKNEFEVVITDECHKISGSPTLQKMFVKVIEKIPARYKFGLTASKKRNDSLTKTIYATVGCNPNGEFKPVWEINRKDANTLTAKHEKIELDTPFSYDMLNPDGSFNFPGLVDYLSNNEKRNETIINKIVEVSKEGRKQLVLCSRIEQCELLHKMLTDRGIKSELLIGKVSAKKREKVLTEKVDWEVIVATISLAKEGLDVPALDTLHLVSCIANQSDTVQSVGRIERVKEGKKEPIVYDYVDVNIPYLTSKYKKRVNWLKRR